MHLRFEQWSQRLRLIEVYDVSRIQVCYGKSVVGGVSKAATFERIYELFGPTFPGVAPPPSTSPPPTPTPRYCLFLLLLLFTPLLFLVILLISLFFLISLVRPAYHVFSMMGTLLKE